MLKDSHANALATFSTRTKWLWLALLVLFIVGAASLVFLSSSARRPSAMHFVAMQIGAFVGYAFFAVLLAAGIKSILKAQWTWHDWANSIVILTGVIFAIRLWSADLTDDSRQSAELSPSSITKDDARTASIVGSWRCKAMLTGVSFVITYDLGGRMKVVAPGSVDPVVDSPVFWDVEDGNQLVQRYADGQRFTKSRITRLTSNSFATLASNGGEVTCDQTSAKRGL